MAVMTMRFNSRILGLATAVRIIFPTGVAPQDGKLDFAAGYAAKKPLPVLWLLHGGSDNYAEFLAAFPGFYCDTGANCKRPGASGNHHNPNFDLDESAFRRVVEFFSAFALRFLGE